ncbi:cytidylate kinase [Pokkaliibacter plantistimulans]|uniref:Cytidylate kinase n=1 Tax=Pokkaliibacter plantistimulans TaxID=1635171 RepID=A0ABX5LYV6_9GAMM|nr:(d)CMP kinase [Pokkaliibacter plantistimulans]PXF31319.1 cytidylate kinase [Pokkaliibacter plantistimulans]
MALKSVPVVTVDGPSGSGKGTICKLLATRLGWHLLDSGALYRLVALASMRHQIAVDDEDSLTVLSAHLDVQFKTAAETDGVHVVLEGEDVTSTIRQEEVGKLASKVATYPGVRQALLERQRIFAALPGLIADGRDMGTVVFPDAPLKIYLVASAEERARRRFLQLQKRGADASFAKILQDIQARDAQDMNRSVAPLKPAADAVTIDSSELDIDAVMYEVEQLLRERELV